MPDPLAQISTRKTPQSERADERQVRNSAGGFTFKVPDQARLYRFLTLGTDGGTYYTREHELTKANADIVIAWAKHRASELVKEVITISEAGRAPRNNPALFALAAAAGLGDDAGRKLALTSLPRVARTGTHLYVWTKYVEQFRGWGRGLRRAVANWYMEADDVEKIAYQVLKYRQREGWSHRDLLRLAHPVGHPSTFGPLFDWIAGRDGTTRSKRYPNIDPAQLPDLVGAFQAAQRLGSEEGDHTAGFVALIQEYPVLSWEMLPDVALTKPKVWEALIENGMPQTALMRQLPRLTRLGVVAPMSAITSKVAAQLSDPARLKKGRVHPINVLIAMRTYAQGHGERGSSTWTPVSAIVDAFDAAFYAAFGAFEPSGKRTMNALDISGSMGSLISGLPLTCREATAALSLVTAATEPQVLTTGFTSAGGRYDWRSSGITPIDISPRQRLDDAVRKVSNLPMGGTDCALPMLWALENKVEIDTFAVYTDNETWAGAIHPHQALEKYRQKTGIPARLVVVGMTATDFTIADPLDPGSMDVAGFDSAVPSLLANFSRGDI